MISAVALLIVQYLCWDCDFYVSKYCIFLILWHRYISMFCGEDPLITSYGSGLNLLCLLYTSCILCSIKYWKLKIEIDDFDVDNCIKSNLKLSSPSPRIAATTWSAPSFNFSGHCKQVEAHLEQHLRVYVLLRGRRIRISLTGIWCIGTCQR